eukprot:m.278254 g.278254  ORF g.278254 m.278254 type:complete len:642 (-) comp16154_c1_seq14:2040-3965(-)
MNVKFGDTTLARRVDETRPRNHLKTLKMIIRRNIDWTLKYNIWSEAQAQKFIAYTVQTFIEYSAGMTPLVYDLFHTHRQRELIGVYPDVLHWALFPGQLANGRATSSLCGRHCDPVEIKSEALRKGGTSLQIRTPHERRTMQTSHKMTVKDELLLILAEFDPIESDWLDMNWLDLTAFLDTWSTHCNDDALINSESAEAEDSVSLDTAAEESISRSHGVRNPKDGEPAIPRDEKPKALDLKGNNVPVCLWWAGDSGILPVRKDQSTTQTVCSHEINSRVSAVEETHAELEVAARLVSSGVNVIQFHGVTYTVFVGEAPSWICMELAGMKLIQPKNARLSPANVASRSRTLIEAEMVLHDARALRDKQFESSNQMSLAAITSVETHRRISAREILIEHLLRTRNVITTEMRAPLHCAPRLKPCAELLKFLFPTFSLDQSKPLPNTHLHITNVGKNLAMENSRFFATNHANLSEIAENDASAKHIEQEKGRQHLEHLHGQHPSWFQRATYKTRATQELPPANPKISRNHSIGFSLAKRALGTAWAAANITATAASGANRTAVDPSTACGNRLSEMQEIAVLSGLGLLNLLLWTFCALVFIGIFVRPQPDVISIGWPLMGRAQPAQNLDDVSGNTSIKPDPCKA